MIIIIIIDVLMFKRGNLQTNKKTKEKRDIKIVTKLRLWNMLISYCVSQLML